jgi:hypothetical protein
MEKNYCRLQWKNQIKRISSTQFNIKATSGNTNTIVDPNNLDLFYNQDNFNNGNFSIATPWKSQVQCFRPKLMEIKRYMLLLLWLGILIQ